MEFLPYEYFYVRTHLTYSQLSKRLQMLTDTSSRLLKPFVSPKKYCGQVTPDGFKVHHWVHIGGYRNPDVDPGSLVTFPPVIIGDFLEGTNGEIIIRMCLRLHWTALLGLLYWFWLYGFIIAVPFIIFLSKFPNTKSYVEYILAIFLVLVLLCTYGTMLTFFKRQVRNEKQYFVGLVQAYEVVENR